MATAEVEELVLSAIPLVSQAPSTVGPTVALVVSLLIAYSHMLSHLRTRILLNSQSLANSLYVL